MFQQSLFASWLLKYPCVFFLRFPSVQFNATIIQHICFILHITFCICFVLNTFIPFIVFVGNHTVNFFFLLITFMLCINIHSVFNVHLLSSLIWIHRILSCSSSCTSISFWISLPFSTGYFTFTFSVVRSDTSGPCILSDVNAAFSIFSVSFMVSVLVWSWFTFEDSMDLLVPRTSEDTVFVVTSLKSFMKPF